MSILSFTAGRTNAAAAVVASAQDDEPAQSRFKIMGQPYRIMTWTADQWAATPAEDRPPLAWPHGDGMASIAPDW